MILSSIVRRAATCAALVAGSAAAPAITAAQGSAPLSAAERATARAVDSHNAEALALLERIVNINSGTMNLAGVRSVADVLRPQLEALGFKTRWVDGASFKRAGHLVAEHPGTGPKILLIGHLDTVFEPSSPFQKYIKLNDSTATGPGVIDITNAKVIAVDSLSAHHVGQREIRSVNTQVQHHC